jgi:hypothetical protein
VINGTEDFGKFEKYGKKEYNFKRNKNNPCKYGKSGPRIICAIFTHQKAHDDIKYIQNTWGRR